MTATAALGAALVACNALTGLDAFDKVACTTNCADATPDVFVPDATDDVSVDAPVDVVIPIPDGASPTSWARWIMPNPPDAGGKPVSEFNYTVNGDGGSITDNVTRLVWSSARGNAADDDFEGAKNYCATLAPAGTWRLPTRIELVTLIDPTHKTPALDPRFQPPVNAWVWTSSVVRPPTLPYRFWSVNLETGEVAPPPQGSSLKVLCVKGT